MIPLHENVFSDTAPLSRSSLLVSFSISRRHDDILLPLEHGSLEGLAFHNPSSLCSPPLVQSHIGIARLSFFCARLTCYPRFIFLPILVFPPFPVSSSTFLEFGLRQRFSLAGSFFLFFLFGVVQLRTTAIFGALKSLGRAQVVSHPLSRFPTLRAIPSFSVPMPRVCFFSRPPTSGANREPWVFLFTFPLSPYAGNPLHELPLVPFPPLLFWIA